MTARTAPTHGCTLAEPHDCVNVRAANAALRRHLDRACENLDAARRRIATLEARLARVLRSAEWHEGTHRPTGQAHRGGVWSRRRAPPSRGGGR